MEANTPRYVPDNFEGSFTFMGISFKWMNVIEGVVIALIAGFLVFELTYDLLLIESFQIIMVCTGVAAAMGFFLGMKGINHDHVYVYLYHMFMQALRRRKMMYNPRVKYETIYLDTYEKTQQSQIMSDTEYTSIANKILSKIKGNHTAPVINNNAEIEAQKAATEENVHYIFEDDIGVIKETPTELRPQTKKIKRKGGPVNEANKSNKEKKKGLFRK